MTNVSGRFLGSSATSLALFLLIWMIQDQGWGADLDMEINLSLFSLRSDIITTCMIVVTTIFSPLALFIYSGALVLILFLYNKRFASVVLIISMVGSAIALVIIKYIAGRIRPPHAFMQIPGYSFPSGHATSAAVFFSFLAWFAGGTIRSFDRRLVVFISCSILTFLVAVSRIYLGVHWYFDIAGGTFLGIFWLHLPLSFSRFDSFL